MVETYAVLTRLPAGLALHGTDAAALLRARFPAEPLALDAGRRHAVLETLAAAGVAGGATYDGLIALQAHAHARTLLTLDRRAADTYSRLGVPFLTI